MHDASTGGVGGGQRAWRPALSDSLLLAAVPVVAQAIQVVYLVGYVGAQGLPFAVIAIDLAGVFIATVILVLALVVLLVYGQLTLFLALRLGLLRPGEREFVTRFLLRFMPLFLLVATVTVRNGRDPALIVVLLAVSGLALLFVRRDFGRGANWDRPEQAAAAARRPGERAVLAAAYGLAILVAVFFFGRGNAINQRAYYVVGGSQPAAVLYMTPDRYYLAELDRANRQLGPGYMVREVGELGGVTITNEPIGPLVRLEPRQP